MYVEDWPCFRDHHTCMTLQGMFHSTSNMHNYREFHRSEQDNGCLLRGPLDSTACETMAARALLLSRPWWLCLWRGECGLEHLGQAGLACWHVNYLIPWRLHVLWRWRDTPVPLFFSFLFSVCFVYFDSFFLALFCFWYSYARRHRDTHMYGVIWQINPWCDRGGLTVIFNTEPSFIRHGVL